MRRILLVEDDPALVAGLCYSMRKDGYEVEAAGSVQAGWDAFLRHAPDLAVLDVGLPDGTGFALCKRIRERSPVPILFLTACDEETQVVMGLDLGGDDYIAKPFRLLELLSRIRALLRRAGENAPAALAAGPFLLDTAQQRAFRGERELPLTQAEYRLFAQLVRNAGHIVPRERLLSVLWDSGGDFVDENTLTVYIRRLREKIEDDPSRPSFLQTVRGAGYRLAAERG